MLAKYRCYMLAAILQKHVLGHNFLTKIHRMMILVSRTMRVKESDGTIHFNGQSVQLSVHPTTSSHLSSHLSVRPSICQFVHPPILLPACLSSSLSFCPFISLPDHQAALGFICPIVCLSGLHPGQLLTVTGDCNDCNCLV